MDSRVFIFLGAAFAAVGCSSTPADPFGPAPAFGPIDAQFKHPTGTFAWGQEVAVFNAYAQESAHGSVTSGLFPQTNSATSKSQAAPFTGLHALGLHTLADPITQASFCAVAQANMNGTGSCSCPAGGTLQWDFSGVVQGSNTGGSVDGVAKLLASGCKSDDVTLDGKAFLDFHVDGQAASNAAAAQGNLTLIYDAHFTYASKADSGNIDMDFELAGGSSAASSFSYLVDADGGSVVVSGSWDPTAKTGTLTVTDTADVWTCTGSNGTSVTCTSAKGATRTVTI